MVPTPTSGFKRESLPADQESDASQGSSAPSTTTTGSSGDSFLGLSSRQQTRIVVSVEAGLTAGIFVGGVFQPYLLIAGAYSAYGTYQAAQYYEQGGSNPGEALGIWAEASAEGMWEVLKQFAEEPHPFYPVP